MITIALVDDHILIRQSLKTLVNKYDDFEVILEAANGKELIHKLKTSTLPDVAIVDVNMPVMDGYATTVFLKKNYPTIKVIGLSMFSNDKIVEKMLVSGATGFITKSADYHVFIEAIYTVASKGAYVHDHISIEKENTYTNELHTINTNYASIDKLTPKEIIFLKLCASELTYKEIAEKINVSHRTIDNYRDNLFEKLLIKSRAGLILYAIKNGIVQIPQ